jgi:oligoendopeptidase F
MVSRFGTFLAPEGSTGDIQGFTKAGELPERSMIPEERRWRLEDIFASEEDWEAAFAEVSAACDDVAAYRCVVFASAARLASFLAFRERIEILAGKVYVHAVMGSHEDSSLSARQAMADRATALVVKLGTAFAFFVPEAMKAGREEIGRLLEELPELKTYAFFFESILRMKDHTLSTGEEEILARSGDLARVPENVFSLFSGADMRFPRITDELGEEIELTEERYYRLSRSTDRRVRKDAFEGIHGTYEAFRNALGAMYSGSVKGDLFYSACRRYPSALDASLYGDNIPASVYDTVIDTVRANLAPLHEYMALRRNVLGVPELHMYDIAAPLAKEPKEGIPYDRAEEIVTDGLRLLGEEYLSVLRKGFSSRWIDIYENKGKRKGAYSWGSYGTHPYVLLNYNGTLRDVFTIAHEMGHALHSWFSHATQPWVYGDYTIFLAEVASTTNEALLSEHLLSTSDDRERTLSLLNHDLEQTRTTLYRQTMFAEFERITHSAAERGEALTPDMLCDAWRQLNEAYYGPLMTIDGPLAMEWARIPHFYSAFYVYKYVTGFSAAVSLSRMLLEGGRGERERYMRFLSRGGSAWSLDILREAGVDMTTPKPIEDAVAAFSRKLALFRRLLSGD